MFNTHLSGSKRWFYSSFFAVATVCIIAFLRDYTFLSLVLLSLCSLGLIATDGNKKSVHVFLAGFILGPLSEAFCVHFGAWEYSNAFMLGIPLYLPFVWGNAALYIKRIVFHWD